MREGPRARYLSPRREWKTAYLPSKWRSATDHGSPLSPEARGATRKQLLARRRAVRLRARPSHPRFSEGERGGGSRAAIDCSASGRKSPGRSSLRPALLRARSSRVPAETRPIRESEKGVERSLFPTTRNLHVGIRLSYSAFL